MLGIGESSIQRLGKDLPEGLIVGARGDHWFLHPEKKNDPAFKAFKEAFKAKTGAWPIYPVYHMAQAFTALQTAYDKAIKANGGNWPTREQVVDAAAGTDSRPASAGRSRCGPRTTRAWKPSSSASPSRSRATTSSCSTT